jgi:hypothetical protein
MSTSYPTSPEDDRVTRRWRAARLVSALVTLLSVVALGLMSLTSARPVTKHTTVIKKVEATVNRTHAAAPATVAAPVSPTVASTPDPVSAAPLTAAMPVTEAAVTAPAADPAPSPTPTPAPATLPPASVPALPACPLPLDAPAQPGGLASLVGLSPLFGPFSAEAFASAAAFQPVLELFGPFLVAFAAAYGTAEPTLAPLVSGVEAFENDGFTVISPLYGPHRAEFLTAETTLATALAPLAETLVTNPAASCVIDIEGVLTGASSS